MKETCSISRETSPGQRKKGKSFSVEREYLSILTGEEALLHIIRAQLHHMTERR